jgi:hypothetical protein
MMKNRTGAAADHVGNGPFDLHLNHLAVVQTYGLSVRRRLTALAGILAVKPLPGAEEKYTSVKTVGSVSRFEPTGIFRVLQKYKQLFAQTCIL